MNSINSQQGPISISDIREYFENTTKDLSKPQYIKVGNDGSFSYVEDKSKSSSLRSIFKAINNNQVLLEKSSIDEIKALKESIRAYYNQSKQKKAPEIQEKVHFYTVRKFFSNILAKHELKELEKSLTKHEIIKNIKNELEKVRTNYNVVSSLPINNPKASGILSDLETKKIGFNEYTQSEGDLFKKTTSELRKANREIKAFSEALSSYASEQIKNLYSPSSYEYKFDNYPKYQQIYQAYSDIYNSIISELEQNSDITDLDKTQRENMYIPSSESSIIQKLTFLKKDLNILSLSLNQAFIIKELTISIPLNDELKDLSTFDYKQRLNGLIELYSYIEIFDIPNKNLLIKRFQDVFEKLRKTEVTISEKSQIINTLITQLSGKEFEESITALNEKTTSFNSETESLHK